MYDSLSAWLDSVHWKSSCDIPLLMILSHIPSYECIPLTPVAADYAIRTRTIMQPQERSEVGVLAKRLWATPAATLIITCGHPD